MRLVYKPINIEIEMEEGVVDIIVIEHTRTYVDFLTSLYNQYNLCKGDIILSDKDRELSIAKTSEIVMNPLLLDVNDKKIITKLYQEIKALSSETLQEETISVNSAIIKYLDRLVENISYDLSFKVEFDFVSLLKMYDVKINANPSSVLEGTVEYIKALHRICNISIFFFINLKDFLTDDEFNMLYEFIHYEKINLLIIESKKTRCMLNTERYWIVDKDLCIIEPR